jgi:hypothetical protein
MTLCGMPLVEDKEAAHVRKALTRSTNEFFKARNDLFRYRENGCAEPPSGQAPKEKVLSEAAISHLVDRSKLGPLTPSVVIQEKVATDDPAPQDSAPEAAPTALQPPLPKRMRRLLRRREQEQERCEKAAAAKLAKAAAETR